MKRISVVAVLALAACSGGKSTPKTARDWMRLGCAKETAAVTAYDNRAPNAEVSASLDAAATAFTTARSLVGAEPTRTDQTIDDTRLMTVHIVTSEIDPQIRVGATPPPKAILSLLNLCGEIRAS